MGLLDKFWVASDDWAMVQFLGRRKMRPPLKTLQGLLGRHLCRPRSPERRRVWLSFVGGMMDCDVYGPVLRRLKRDRCPI